MRRRRWLLISALALLALGAALYYYDQSIYTRRLGEFPTRILATFVDAETDEPLHGVSVLTLTRARSQPRVDRRPARPPQPQSEVDQTDRSGNQQSPGPG
jgi:hypothetical protein